LINFNSLTKRRNRLTIARLNALVYIHFNLKMMNKREKIKSKIMDVLISSETTTAQGLLFEDGDDCAKVVHRDEDDEVMSGTDIPYSVIGKAMGMDEQLQLRRSARMRA
jgi:hypothetical protein